MNDYQFEQIIRRTERNYGKMKRGDEDLYQMLLWTLESNALKIRRKHKNCNSRRLKEALLLTLYSIEDRINGTSTDLQKFENEENLKLKNALLMAFDPFSNEDVAEVVNNTSPEIFSDTDKLKEYYKYPAICLMRIKDSVEFWEKNNGADGYFDFIESNIGMKIEQNEKMNFTIHWAEKEQI